MPITRKQFELGIDSKVEALMKEIHSFLASHPSEAFNVAEIQGAIAGDHSSYGEVESALEKLAELWVIDEGLVDSTAYYVYLRELPELH
jgi:hypothetical protein